MYNEKDMYRVEREAELMIWLIRRRQKRNDDNIHAELEQ